MRRGTGDGREDAEENQELDLRFGKTKWCVLDQTLTQWCVLDVTFTKWFVLDKTLT